jgi:hypothetical protein
VEVETRAGKPVGATVLGSATGAAAAISATLAAAAGERTYIDGFCVSGSGATAASRITVTITGLSTTLSFVMTIPAGATVAVVSLVGVFSHPVAASADNTAVVVNVPSFGAGNTNAAVAAWGHRQ